METDRLTAISGIAKSIHEKTGLTYLAGLWNYNIENQLLWRVINSEESKRYGTYVAPSWSWASVQGEIDMLQAFYRENRFPCAKVLETSVIPIASPFSQVSEGSFIKLRGQLMKAYTYTSHTGGDLSRRMKRWAVFDTSEEIDQAEIYWLLMFNEDSPFRRESILRRNKSV